MSKKKIINPLVLKGGSTIDTRICKGGNFRAFCRSYYFCRLADRGWTYTNIRGIRICLRVK